MLTRQYICDIIYERQREDAPINGGIAQLARASGSYPAGHRFKSYFRYQLIPTKLGIRYGPLVKRLRHGPFTAVTWVRFPYGSPKNKQTLLCLLVLFLII